MRRRVALALLATSACAVYGSSLLLPKPDAGASDGGADAAAACVPARWPDRPAQDDPSQGDVEVLTALSSFSFSTDQDASLGGFDLDSVCTCAGEPPAPESCVSSVGAAHCDLEAGIDNSGGQLLYKLSQLGGVLSPDSLTQSIQSGSGSMLFRVQGYNGQPNDTQVSFSVYPSNGTIPDDAGKRPSPDFDGGDKWTVDTNALVGGVAPPYLPSYVDPSAYVAGGVLVAHVDFPFQVGTRSVSSVFVRLKGTVVSAKLAVSGGRWSLDGMLVGRWPTGNFLTALQGVVDPFDKNQHLCGDSGTYQTIKKQVCRAADVTSNLLFDGKGAPCDAISLTFVFRSSAALFGPAEPATPAAPPCGITYADDCL